VNRWSNAGLVERRKQGRTNFLTLRRQPLIELQAWAAQSAPTGVPTTPRTRTTRSTSIRQDRQEQNGEEVRRTDLRFHAAHRKVRQEWGAWFGAVEPRLVDPGNPFGRGVELTTTSRTELTLDSPTPLVGYCILNAEDTKEAEELVSTMPIIDSVRIYEAHSM
jgi:hypothetical protein